MTVHHQDDTVTLHHGDCLDILRDLPDASVDAVVTDPPYELGFMGKGWDSSGIAYNVDLWRHALRVLKPGGHLLAFGGTRTWHRLACAIEDAGFEVRDSIAWLYGSGFPKSLDVSKAIDKAAGAEREVVGRSQRHGGGVVGNGSSYEVSPDVPMLTAPATDDARKWQGWGTALKPAHEPIVVARKPLAGTVAANVLAHGTGALNIDATRIGDEVRVNGDAGNVDGSGWGMRQNGGERVVSGRWPANVVLDEHQAAELDEQSGTSTSRASAGRNGSDEAAATFGLRRAVDGVRGHDDRGGASRFFYVAKAPTKERPTAPDGTRHPTVKPLTLMRWLVRLVTPPGGVVLEPFAGSGTTIEAAVLEGFRCVAIEREADYLPLIMQRLDRLGRSGTGAPAAATSPPDAPTEPAPAVPDLGPTVDERITEHVETVERVATPRATDKAVHARHADIPQDGLFDMAAVEKPQGERGTTVRAVGSGECPSCHAKVGHVRDGDRVVWRTHNTRTYGGVPLRCGASETEVA